MNRTMIRTISTSAIMALSLALGGCGGTTNAGLESVHQPVVNRVDYAFDLRTGGSGDLAAGESQRLTDWFTSLKLGYGDRISVDDPSPYGSTAGREAIAAVAARHGLLLSEGAPVTSGAVADGMVRVVVSRQSASVPGCPDWSRSSQPEYQASGMSNYGCATNTNLAAMIANPEDLVRGQSGGPDQRASTKAIRSYRDRALSGASELKAETTKEEN